VSDRTSFLRLVDAMIRYYYGISQEQVDQLTDEEWAEHFADLKWLRQKEAESGQENK
jgi:hypothetical protein